MKFRNALLTLPFLAALQLGVATAADPGPAAPALPAAPADASPNFNRVMSRLDIGGKLLHFEDHEGRRETYIDLVKAFIAGTQGTMAEAAAINPAALVDASGLAQATASGRSMKKDSAGHWLLRQYDYLPKGPTGFATLLGKQPVKFRGPTQLPATTDLVVESRLDGTALPGVVRALAKACGQSEVVAHYLAEPLPLPVEVNLEQVLAKTDLQILLAADISTWKAEPSSLEQMDFILRIDGAGGLLPLFLPVLEEALGGSSVQAGGQRGWELPLPPPMQEKSLLLYDDKGTLTYASSAAYLKSIESAGPKLATAKEYQEATSGFAESGNLLVYVSPQAATTVGSLIRRSAPVINAEGAPAIEFLTKYLTPEPWSLCMSCEPDGILTLVRMPQPLEFTGGPLPYLAGTSVLFVGARAWKQGSDRAACIMNTRNVQQAVRAYQNMNDLKIGDPLPLKEIFGEDKYLLEPRCPLGGTYTFSKTIPQLGKLACTCDHADHVPADHENW